ncbi:uncharacterized protein LOC111072696 isoform X2 [Drosophila obscura]|uniref:uncharacterized protein LOC111072696 isoform X2 n=1 Tax=Drosophila obscura TaxID=7282 RepID=UPI000BA07560|nr:uncharacterized protein LOC111072696 isoform X2 [Drosophila obscura]
MCFLGPSCKWLCKCSSFRASLFWACWNIIFGLVLIDQVLDFVRAQKLATVIKVIGCVSGAGFTLSGAMLLAGILKGSRCLVCASIVVCGLSTLVIHWLIVPLALYIIFSIAVYTYQKTEMNTDSEYYVDLDPTV